VEGDLLAGGTSQAPPLLEARLPKWHTLSAPPPHPTSQSSPRSGITDVPVEPMSITYKTKKHGAKKNPKKIQQKFSGTVMTRFLRPAVKTGL
jgi:hypothetical protein